MSDYLYLAANATTHAANTTSHAGNSTNTAVTNALHKGLTTMEYVWYILGSCVGLCLLMCICCCCKLWCEGMSEARDRKALE